MARTLQKCLEELNTVCCSKTHAVICASYGIDVPDLFRSNVCTWIGTKKKNKSLAPRPNLIHIPFRSLLREVSYSTGPPQRNNIPITQIIQHLIRCRFLFKVFVSWTLNTCLSRLRVIERGHRLENDRSDTHTRTHQPISLSVCVCV